MKVVRGFSVACAVLVSSALCCGAPAPWHQPLSYDAGGYWTVRAPVEIENVLDAALEGAPVSVPVRTDDGTAGLIGAAAASVRVVAASGNELLFDLQDSTGSLKRSGKVAAGDVITLPAEAQPKGKTTVFLYAGNESAWLPPNWLRAGLVNAGFEHGADAPDGWTVWGVDDKHKMSRQKDGAHAGDWCARCEVAEGAERTWVKYAQGGIPVIAGQKYRLTAWVKAQSVRGRAGWYVHVDGAKPQMVNRTEGWEGTYDWRQMTIAFDVPEGGQTFSCGTLLYGTGVAWYDDVKLEMLGAAGAVKVKVLPTETMRLRPVGKTFFVPPDKEWPFCAPLRIRNFTDADMPQAVVSFDMRRVRNRVAKLIGFTAQPGLRIMDPQSPGQPLPFAGALTEDLRVMTNVPAKSEKVLWLYVSQNAQAPGRSPQAKFEDWAAGRSNMTPNGDMEEAEGERPRAWTTGEEGRTGEPRFIAKRVSGGLRGQWCLELSVPATVKDPGWAGWRQKVPVKPLTRYLLAGYVKTKGVDGQVSIHGHFRKADGTHTERPFFGTQPGVKGDSDWTLTTTTVTTPADCAFIEIHLTMNCHGTVWHDAVLLAETSGGAADELQTATPETGEMRAWVVNPLVKVFGEDLPPVSPVQQVSAYAARNEYEAFQVAVRGPRDAVLKITASPLTGPGGAKLDPPAVWHVGRVPMDFPIGYDSSDQPSYHRLLPRHRGNDGWAGWWPDPLRPVREGQVSLKAATTEALWFDVHVPASAAPGQYQGHVEVQVDGKSSRIPVLLTVWNFTQPEGKHLPALYDLRLPGQQTEAVRAWYRLVARYNVSPAFVIPNPDFKYENGRVTMDTAKFDESARYLLDELKVNKVYTPNFFYACGWAYPPKKLFGLEAFTPEYVKAWTDAYRLFIEHITRKGWRKKFVFYISDEPDQKSEATIGGIARIADMAKSIAPDVLVYSSTWRHIEGLEGHLTLWGIGPQGSFADEKRQARKAAGDHFWFTTDGQMCTDTPLLAIERLLPWFCFKYDVEAYEFWGVNWWTYDPWQQGWHKFIRQSHDGKTFRWVRYPNGDGFLAYPGSGAGQVEPLPSIRLVAAREGVDDYEMFLALRRHADEGNAQARKALDRVRSLVQMPNRGGRYSTAIMADPDAVQAARIVVGDLLSELIAR